jgi:hypothetical protein
MEDILSSQLCSVHDCLYVSNVRVQESESVGPLERVSIKMLRACLRESEIGRAFELRERECVREHERESV